MSTRRAARTDANHQEIVQTLRKHGALVVDTSGVGNGFPDLVVAFRGHTALVEVKDGAKSPSRRKTTPDQDKFHAAWIGGTLCIVDSVDAAIRVLRVMDRSGSPASNGDKE